MKYSKIIMTLPTDEQIENELKTLSCIIKDCYHEPEFNFVIFGNPLFCQIHRDYVMMRVKDNVCSEKNCEEIAIYGDYFPGTDIALPMTCEFHKGRDSKKLFQRPCSIENCDKTSTHGVGKFATHCLEHKDETKMNRLDFHYRCEIPDCHSIGKYNYPRKKIPVRCERHKTDIMVNICKLAICEIKNCNKIPCFVYGASTIPRRCEDHKTKKMREIKVALCSAEDCCNFATVRRRNTEESRFTCEDHTDFDDTDLIRVRGNILLCMDEKCDRLATYGNKNRSRSHLTRCSLHKDEHMFGPFYVKLSKSKKKRKRREPLDGCSSFYVEENTWDVREATDTLLVISKMSWNLTKKRKMEDESEEVDILNI